MPPRENGTIYNDWVYRENSDDALPTNHTLTQSIVTIHESIEIYNAEYYINFLADLDTVQIILNLLGIPLDDNDLNSPETDSDLDHNDQTL